MFIENVKSKLEVGHHVEVDVNFYLHVSGEHEVGHPVKVAVNLFCAWKCVIITLKKSCSKHEIEDSIFNTL